MTTVKPGVFVFDEHGISRDEGWVWLRFEHPCKPHAVHVSQAEALIRDLSARGYECVSAEPMAEYSQDLPGMVMMGRAVMSFALRDGLSYGVPATDLGVFLAKLEGSRLRSFSEVYDETAGYHKIHSWLSCFVLSETDRVALVDAMRERAAEADRLGRADDDRLGRAVEKLTEDGHLAQPPKGSQ